MRARSWSAVCALALCASVLVVSTGTGPSGSASAASNSSVLPTSTEMRFLLIGAADDPPIGAWADRLASEGVPFTRVQPGNAAELAAPALVEAADSTRGRFNAVVIDSANGGYSSSELADVYAYEARFGVRQVDAYVWPTSAIGLTYLSGSDPVEGTTATLTTAALAGDFGYLKGPVPLESGTYGYPASVDSGAPFTPYLTGGGGVLAGVYQHPDVTTDPQSGVAEMALTFNYNYHQMQWLLLAPGLIDWVTNGRHLGLYRNYLGEDIDDVFIPDNVVEHRVRVRTDGDGTSRLQLPFRHGPCQGSAGRSHEFGRRRLRRRLAERQRLQAQPGLQRLRRDLGREHRDGERTPCPPSRVQLG